MTNKLSDRLAWKHHPHRLPHQLDAIPAARNPVPELEIVGMKIRHPFPPADLPKVFLGGRHRPAVGELHFLFKPSRHERARGGVQAHPQRVQIRRDPAIGPAPVKGGYRTHFGIGERCGRDPQIVRFHAHIAVAHDYEVVFCLMNKAAQAIYLAIGPHSCHTFDQPDGAVWKIGLQSLDDGHDGVIWLCHCKNDFVFGIIEPAVTCEILVGFVVHTAHGFQNTRGRRERGCQGMRFPQLVEITYDAIKRQKVISQRRGRQS